MFKFLNFEKPLQTSVYIYLITLGVLWIIKPRIIFDKDGKLKKFGTGNQKSKSVIPLWLIIALIAVLIFYIVAIGAANYSRKSYCDRLISGELDVKQIFLDKCPTSN